MIPWLHIDTTRIPGGGEMRLMQRGAEFSIRLGGNELMSSRLSATAPRSLQGSLMEIIALIVFFIAVLFIARSVKVVPQQNAWIVERLGRYHATLAPGLNILVPFVDRLE